MKNQNCSLKKISEKVNKNKRKKKKNNQLFLIHFKFTEKKKASKKDQINTLNS